MKLIDGIKLIGRPAEIPNAYREDLPDFFKELGFKTGVEIGVYTGQFTERFAKAGLQVYGVDPWMVYDDFSFGKSQRRENRHYESAKERLTDYPNCTLIRKTSMDAVKDFENGSIDFVYIDGNHTFKYIAEDICEWTKKVRQGGIISGHDYFSAKGNYVHVRYVVDAYVAAFNLNFWVMGHRRSPERDKWRSWMWFKP